MEDWDLKLLSVAWLHWVNFLRSFSWNNFLGAKAHFPPTEMHSKIGYFRILTVPQTDVFAVTKPDVAYLALYGQIMH